MPGAIATSTYRYKRPTRKRKGRAVAGANGQRIRRVSDDTEDCKAMEFDHEAALDEAVRSLAMARVAIAMVANRFDASATPLTDAKAAADQEELPIAAYLSRARACLADAAMALLVIREGMASATLPPDAKADLDRRLSAADRDLTELLRILLPPTTLLVPFYAANEGKKPAPMWPT